MAAHSGAPTKTSTSPSFAVSLSAISMAPSSPDASSTSSPSEPTSLPAPPSKPGSKPVKLRAACNRCFSAKVRCDGNTKGCRRCSEKRFPCVYSESRVGKVVGKRRKRPVEDPLGDLHSQTWVVNATGAIQSIPSSTNSPGSDESIRRHWNQPVWATSAARGDQEYLSLDDTAFESMGAMEMTGNRSFSLVSDGSFLPECGLPTPALSPPQFSRNFPSARLQSRPPSSQCFALAAPSKLHPPSHAGPLARRLTMTQEDEETVCIRLLAHLKRHGKDGSRPRHAQIQLLKNCNAVVRKILPSKTLHSDYACQLVLSSILSHLVRLCERLCDQLRLNPDKPTHADSQFLQDLLHWEESQPFSDSAGQRQNSTPSDQETMMGLLKDVLSFTLSVGDMLKKKPVNGFQPLGRHETFVVELEQRLKRAMALLQP